MKILIATGIFPPSIGGPATYSKLLLDELPKYGFNVKVVSFDEVRHMPKIIRHLSYFWRVFKEARKSDIVYAQDPVSVGLPALFAARWAFKKFYLKIVGDYAWEQGVQRKGVQDNLDTFSTRGAYPFLVKLLKRVQYFVAWNADRIIVPSAYLKKIVTNWGISPEVITVIYNAFEAHKLPSETYDSLRKKYDFNAPVVTSVGRLVPWKGFEMLIEIIADISHDIKNIKLLIIGEGPDREKLQKKIHELHAEDSIMLTGKLDQQELFTFVKASDVFVLNTEYEGFSHQLLEVMVLGTPIITTRVGGNVELITNGQNGLLVNYNDKAGLTSAILTMLKVEGEGKKLAGAAKETVTSFGKERMFRELVDVLKKAN